MSFTLTSVAACNLLKTDSAFFSPGVMMITLFIRKRFDQTAKKTTVLSKNTDQRSQAKNRVTQSILLCANHYCHKLTSDYRFHRRKVRKRNDENTV